MSERKFKKQSFWYAYRHIIILLGGLFLLVPTCCVTMLVIDARPPTAAALLEQPIPVDARVIGTFKSGSMFAPRYHAVLELSRTQYDSVVATMRLNPDPDVLDDRPWAFDGPSVDWWSPSHLPRDTIYSDFDVDTATFRGTVYVDGRMYLAISRS